MSEGRSSVLTVRCNGCGAPLEIRPGSRYVTCLHCDSQLEVHRTSNSISTEVLERLDARTESMAADLEVIRLHQQLERIDRESLQRRQDGSGGGADDREAAAYGGAFLSLFVVVLGIGMTGAATAVGSLLFLVGPIICLVGVIAMITFIRSGIREARLERRVDAERQRVLRRLQELEAASS